MASLLRCTGLLSAAAAFVPLAASASDWPQFLGPTRNGIYTGSDLADTWPKEGPPVLWQKSIGQGFSGPAVANGRVIMFHRLNDQETIDCFDSQPWTIFWSFNQEPAYHDDFVFDEGTR